MFTGWEALFKAVWPHTVGSLCLRSLHLIVISLNFYKFLHLIIISLKSVAPPPFFLGGGLVRMNRNETTWLASWLPQHRALSAQSSSFPQFCHEVRRMTLVLCRVRLSLYHTMQLVFPKSVFLNMNILGLCASWGYCIILFRVFTVFVEWNRHFYMGVLSDVCGRYYQSWLMNLETAVVSCMVTTIFVFLWTT
jgi:hypothetical protein